MLSQWISTQFDRFNQAGIQYNLNGFAPNLTDSTRHHFNGFPPNSTDNWLCASDDKNGKVLNFNGLKGCKSNFGHFSLKYADISLFQFDITELFNIELME